MNICLNQLDENFHRDDAVPPLIRVAIIHRQFETIRPFLGGNGRIGRRSKAVSELSAAVPEMVEIKERLKQAEKSLDVATNGRSWKNMEVFRAEVAKLRKLMGETPKAQVLGTSLEQTLWMQAVLLILLRALLLAASALNALRCRD